MTIAALILAAGQGTRFGAEPKLLAPLGGKPLVRHVADAALASSARPVLLVTGHRAAEVEAAAGPGVRAVPNPDFAEGLSTSLRAGFAALPPEAEAAIVLLGDMPGVSAALVDRLISAWEAAGRPPALAPTRDGRRGNPVLLSRALAPAVSALMGDRGAGPLLASLAGVAELAVDDPGVLFDVDTPEALRHAAAGAQP